MSSVLKVLGETTFVSTEGLCLPNCFPFTEASVRFSAYWAKVLDGADRSQDYVGTSRMINPR